MIRTVVGQKDIQRMHQIIKERDAEPYVLNMYDIKSIAALDKKSLPKPDNYISRLLKYIPSEVIALYITFDALIRSSGDINLQLYWLIFIFGVIATPLYLWRVQKVYKSLQLIISTVAFFVWVFAIGGPFAHLDWYDPLYGGLLLPAYTFLISIIEA